MRMCRLCVNCLRVDDCAVCVFCKVSVWGCSLLCYFVLSGKQSNEVVKSIKFLRDFKLSTFGLWMFVKSMVTSLGASNKPLLVTVLNHVLWKNQ